MHVLIDATPLLLRSAGVKTYVYHWVRHLVAQANGRSLELFPLLDSIGECVHDRSAVGPARTIAGLALLQLANLLPGPTLFRFGRRADVFHTSHQLKSAPRHCRVTATIYDMTCWLVPNTHSSANVTATRSFSETMMRSADGLIAISDSTRLDAVRILGLDPDRIVVIYPGVAESYFRASDEERQSARRRYGLLKPYVLYVGTLEPRKNLHTLLAAWRAMPASTRSEFDLVLAGPLGWGYGDLLPQLQTTPGVRYLGYVPEQYLPGLNAAATVFVYPSLYEGFGLPAAQALAAGVPVVASNISSLPEVVREGGLLVDPRSPNEMRSAIESLLLSSDLRQKLGAEGARQALAFQWETSARSSWRFFERVLGR